MRRADGAYIISYIVLFLVFWTPLSAQEEWLMAVGGADDAQISSLVAGQIFIAAALSVGSWAQLLWADRSAALARP
jgi:hypothetical protein